MQHKSISEDLTAAGLRHFPEDVAEDSEDDKIPDRSLPSHLKQSKEGNFQYKTRKQCHEEFPAWFTAGFCCVLPRLYNHRWSWRKVLRQVKGGVQQ